MRTISRLFYYVNVNFVLGYKSKIEKKITYIIQKAIILAVFDVIHQTSLLSFIALS